MKGWRELKIWLINQMLVWGKERGTENRIVPVKDYASLTSFGLILGTQPDFVVGESGHELRPDLLV